MGNRAVVMEYNNICAICHDIQSGLLVLGAGLEGCNYYSSPSIQPCRPRTRRCISRVHGYLL